MLLTAIDSEKLAGRLNHYAAMNRLTNFLSRIHIAWVTNSIVTICAGPVLVLLYAKYITADPLSMRRLPVALVFPFDTQRSPAYECVFALSFVSITCIGYTMVLTDCVFLGTCAQIVACQRDLQDMLGEIHGAAGVLLFTDQVSMEVGQRWKECTRFHNDILKQYIVFFCEVACSKSI